MSRSTPDLVLPDSPLTRAALAAVRAAEAVPIINHSIRSFLFADLIGQHEGATEDADYDRELLFAACIMHDLGTGSGAPAQQRFEVEGADLAAEVLTAHGVEAARVDRVWQAIALHTSPGIANRMGLLTYLTHVGVSADFGIGAESLQEHGSAIHALYPRLDMVRVFTDAVAAHAANSAATAPPFSLPGEVLQERQRDGITGLERGAPTSIWGS